MKQRFIGVISIFIFFMSSSASRANEACSTPVPTKEGPVIGIEGLEPGGCAYKGIPYAEPPVGDRRWKPPQPAVKRPVTFNADRFGPECSQVEMIPGFLLRKKPIRSEDCLYINIWRPSAEGKYPVMFWIHGGGLTSGSGSNDMYWGDRLAAKKDVVLVTFNYRLAALGFLAHEGLSAEDENQSSGNYGLLDQIAALEWVRDNIANFGGDPGNVTIFGESAGGRSVCIQMATPLSAGLFHKGIMQSGRCSGTIKTMEFGFKEGREMAAKLGCDGKDAVACMRSKTPDEIVEVSENPFKAENRGISFAWGGGRTAPHLDGWVMVKSPVEALESGEYNRVPFMVGSTRDEFKIFAPLFHGLLYRNTRKSKVVKGLQKALGNLYAPFIKLYPFENYKKPMDMYVAAKSDQVMGCKGLEAADASSKYQPTWYYRFDYDDSRLPDLIGASHAIEMPFVFDTMDMSLSNLLYSEKQRKRARPLVENMMDYWTNFAKTGNPNGGGLKNWPRYDTSKHMRMYLDIPLKVQPTDNLEKCEFWQTNAAKLK